MLSVPENYMALYIQTESKITDKYASPEVTSEFVIIFKCTNIICHTK